LVSASALTPAGANFVRKSLDPFHDFETPLNGLPDESTSRVVIQEITKTVIISSNQGVGATWDCHIAQMPELITFLSADPAAWDARVGTRSSTGTVSAVGTPQPSRLSIGPILYSRVSSGFDTFVRPSASIPPLGTIDTISFNEYADGQKRVIGMAFEVVNTTAPLYRSGAVAVYRMPQTIEQSSMAVVNQDLSTSMYTAIESRSPPSIISDALLYGGSKQWAAEEGCYVVGIMEVNKNKLQGNNYGPRIFTPADISQVGSIVMYGHPAASNYCQPCKPLAFHTGGAYFTGLSDQTTLQLTVRLLIENSPTTFNPQLVVLTQPAADYDPLAIEIYKKAAVHLPVGVPVGENASGDFWDKVLGIIATVSPTLSTIAGFGPLGSAIGAGATSLSKWRNNRDKAQAEKESRERTQLRKQIESMTNFKKEPGDKNIKKPITQRPKERRK
jgi:hypothetical protein